MKMRKFYNHLVLILLLAFSVSGFGQTAIYSEDILLIPQGAIFDEEEGHSFYQNIELRYTGEGGFTLHSAEPMDLVQVESVDVLVMESFPVQVSVSVNGHLSVPCVELLDPAISMKGNVFTVLLAETRLGPAQTCIQTIEPFEKSIALEVLDLPAGTYSVVVNGLES